MKKYRIKTNEEMILEKGEHWRVYFNAGWVETMSQYFGKEVNEDQIIVKQEGEFFEYENFAWDRDIFEEITGNERVKVKRNGLLIQ